MVKTEVIKNFDISGNETKAVSRINVIHVVADVLSIFFLLCAYF